eukprot:500810-Amphidinium_carterae.1
MVARLALAFAFAVLVSLLHPAPCLREAAQLLSDAGSSWCSGAAALGSEDCGACDCSGCSASVMCTRCPFCLPAPFAGGRARSAGGCTGNWISSAMRSWSKLYVLPVAVRIIL